MPKITVKELERKNLVRALEEERARRMRGVFEATEALGEFAAFQARGRARARVPSPRSRRLPVAVALGLALATGGALALEVSGTSLREVWSVFRPESTRAESERGGQLGRKNSETSETGAKGESKPGEGASLPPAPRGASPKARISPSSEAPGRKSGAKSAPPSPQQGHGAPAPKDLPSRGALPIDPDFAEPEKGEPSVRAESWNRVAEALGRNDFEAAERETAGLSGASDAATREAAQLVQVQLALKRAGKLSSDARATLEELSRTAVSANVRQEAVRILSELEK